MIMKKLLLILVTIMMPIVASADAVEIDGIYYNLLSKSGSNVAEVTYNPNLYSGDVVIPESVKYDNIEYKVISLGKGSFTGCINLKSITLPNSIETVHEEAFDYYSFLNDYTQEGIIHIQSLSSWLKIKFEGGGTPLYYAHHLYLNGEEIKELTIPDDITSIPHNAFRGCLGLTSVKIPNIVTTIGYYSFDECYNLNSVEIPNSVVEIGPGAFSHCESLESIVIPNSVQKLGEGSFQWCYNLKSVELSNKITKIDSYTFYGCSNLTSINIPEGVTTIGYAFPDCKSLTTITLPQSISVITDEAFKDCISLSDVYCYMSKLSTSMKSNAFDGCYIEHATLHVPENLIALYSNVEPWKNFKSIIKIDMPKYNLSFSVDGQIYKTFQIEEGETITPEPEPTKEGYTFSGWSEIPETMPAQDVTITGSFSINKYKLTYKVDGEVYKTYDIDYSTSITPETAPTKEGYTFSGWSEIPETMPAHDVTISGTFAINQYTITYKIDDEVYQTENVDYGSMITPPNAPEREGYTFEWIDVPETMPAHDITIVGSYTSGINAIRMEAENGKVFDLNGRQVKTPGKGVYIINGRKVAIK